MNIHYYDAFPINFSFTSNPAQFRVPTVELQLEGVEIPEPLIESLTIVEK
jgi:hypothetical protein